MKFKTVLIALVVLYFWFSLGEWLVGGPVW